MGLRNPESPDRSFTSVPFATTSVPTALTAINTVDCYLREFIISNPTASPITLLIEDGAGVILIPGNDQILPGGYVAFSGWQYMTGGIKWQAGATGMHARGRYLIS